MNPFGNAAYLCQEVFLRLTETCVASRAVSLRPLSSSGDRFRTKRDNVIQVVKVTDKIHVVKVTETSPELMSAAMRDGRCEPDGDADKAALFDLRPER